MSRFDYLRDKKEEIAKIRERNWDNRFYLEKIPKFDAFADKEDRYLNLSLRNILIELMKIKIIYIVELNLIGMKDMVMKMEILKIIQLNINLNLKKNTKLMQVNHKMN